MRPRSSTEQTGEGFRCRVFLPNNSPVRECLGPPQPSPRLARGAAFVTAVGLLHQVRLQVNRSRCGSRAGSGGAELMCQRVQVNLLRLGSVWDPPSPPPAWPGGLVCDSCQPAAPGEFHVAPLGLEAESQNWAQSSMRA